ncbi:hypothetical protein KY290_005725 [Solanum tuberosum]|uniref:Uncharacterized protein n=1 Tax=Solanum tuberosum TaxID=4113 RepID=A0ABQ7WF08_SOLTU|nr:hypothetical protein KY284_005784 [Solanum tuberosum]KAH0752472.1 hypothetical protein KY285_005620 [Solanum tuberosum]KAH0779298.1 hypothetical protein KY290_005725 [Solanum tuberosum]
MDIHRIGSLRRKLDQELIREEPVNCRDCRSLTKNTNIWPTKYEQSSDALGPGVLATHSTFTQRKYQRIMHMLDKEDGEAADNIVANIAMAGATCHMTSKLGRLTHSRDCDLSNERVKGIGKELDGLYYLPSRPTHGENKANEMLLMA